MRGSLGKKYWFKRFVPQSLGGPGYNYYNAFIGRLQTPSEYRPSFREFLLNPLEAHAKVIRQTRAPLWDWIKEHKPRRILEIGLGSSANARKMIELSGGCSYFCFDDLATVDFEDYDELRRRPNTSFYIGDTMETLPKFADSLPKMDLIFIDGAHDYKHVKNDWKYCKRLMHSTTACFFHDWQKNDVKKVVDGIGKEFNVEIPIPPYPPSFALVQKR